MSPAGIIAIAVAVAAALVVVVALGVLLAVAVLVKVVRSPQERAPNAPRPRQTNTS